jgi:hypothetical protein
MVTSKKRRPSISTRKGEGIESRKRGDREQEDFVWIYIGATCCIQIAFTLAFTISNDQQQFKWHGQQQFSMTLIFNDINFQCHQFSMVSNNFTCNSSQFSMPIVHNFPCQEFTIFHANNFTGQQQFTIFIHFIQCQEFSMSTVFNANTSMHTYIPNTSIHIQKLAYI